MPVIGESITLTSSDPNFDRDRVEMLSSLKKATEKVYDIGHIVYCDEDSTHYKFMGKEVELDEITGYFRRLIPETQEVPDLTDIESQIESNTERINRLYEKEFPTTASIGAYNDKNVKLSNLLEGESIDIILKFSLKQDGQNVNFKDIDKIVVSWGGNSKELLNFTEQYTIKGVSQSTTYKVTYHLNNGNTKSATTSISFNPYSYYGVVNEDVNDINENNLSLLTPVLLSSRGYTITITQDNQKNCFVYPSKFGELTSIKDSKNYELIGSYTKISKTLNGKSYYVYLLTDASTVENYKIIFS